MDIVLAVYLALAFVLVPVFRTEGRFGVDYAKDWMFTSMAGATVVIVLMFHGKLLFVNDPWMLGFFGFVCVSLLWTDHQFTGRREVVRLLAVLAFVGIAAQLPKSYLLLACFVPAPFFSLHGIIQQIWKKDLCDRRREQGLTKRTRFASFCLSPNHAAAFLVMQGFLGIWLTLNDSIWFSIPTTIVFLGVVLSQCRAAQLGSIVGISILLPWSIPLLILAGIVAAVKWPGCMDSIKHRWLMTRAAYEVFRRAPLFGAGPRSFRIKHTRAVAELNQKDPTILGTPGSPGRHQFTVGRRVHNDLMETLSEYGIVGTVLAAGMMSSILWRLSSDWILFTGAVAVLVNAMMFFPFRDTMISMPFWTVVAATGEGTQMPVGLVPALIGSALILYIVYQYSVRPYMANRRSARGDLLGALKWEPYSTEYLFELSYEGLIQNKYVLALNAAEKALFFYDGERPEHAIIHNYGQAAMVNGAFQVADAAYRQALVIHPSDKTLQGAVRELDRIKKQVETMETRKAA